MKTLTNFPSSPTTRSRLVHGLVLQALTLLVLALGWALPAYAMEEHVAGPALCPKPGRSVLREEFVAINGIEQWITIKGTHCDNPAILFLHGGPANPISPYADAIYGPWQETFTLVQWDQRGAGKTFMRNPATADGRLSIPLMVADGIAVAENLRRRLGQRKIILMGSSWGSVLGIRMIQARPDLFHAYIGSSQLVDRKLNAAASYEKTLALVRAANDQENLRVLEELGPPPWSKPNGVLRRVNRAYEAKATTPAPKNWWIPDPAYRMEEMAAQYEAAEDYSFLQFVGLNNDGMYSQVDFPRTATEFALPVFFVQGEQDLVTAPEVTQAWFDAIQAPDKKLVLVRDAGHGPNEASVAAEYALLVENVLPAIGKH